MEYCYSYLRRGRRVAKSAARAALIAALLCGLLAARRSPAAEPAGRTVSKDAVSKDAVPKDAVPKDAVRPADAWLHGLWLHRRTDQPGPDESTWRILKIDADHGWTCAELWGTPEKPMKLEVYGRGQRARLAPMSPELAKFYIAGASAEEKVKRAFNLVLPDKDNDNSTLNLGAMVRLDDGSIEFHNFLSIHWTTRYVRAEAETRASLEKLLEKTPPKP